MAIDIKLFESMYDLKGRKALVTGSSQGIGRAIALGLAGCGADIFIHYSSNLAEAQRTIGDAEKAGVRIYSGKVDFCGENPSEKLYSMVYSQMGSIDILVLNASIQVRNEWGKITDEEFDRQVKVNFKTHFELIQLFAPHMLKNKWGRILAVGSVQQYKPHPDMAIYAALKDAQMNLVRNLAGQFARDGVTVNNLAPGVIDTARNKENLADANYCAKVISKIPAGFIADADDCKGAALLLCSDAGRYITGAEILVDGGMHL